MMMYAFLFESSKDLNDCLQSTDGKIVAVFCDVRKSSRVCHVTLEMNAGIFSLAIIT